MRQRWAWLAKWMREQWQNWRMGPALSGAVARSIKLMQTQRDDARSLAKQLEAELAAAREVSGIPGLTVAEIDGLAIMAEHAGRAAMLAGRVLRYGWEERKDQDAPTLRTLLRRETDTLISVAKRVHRLCAEGRPGDGTVAK
jgi:hypothetical protein